MSKIAPARIRIGILSAWASRLGGGVFEAIIAHCAVVRDSGFEPVVIALSDEFSEADRTRFGNTEVITLGALGPSKIGFAPGLLRALLRADLDLLHLHGIWMFPSAAAARWAKVTGKPYIISPHGMLAPWVRSKGKLKKAAAKWAYERRSWNRATVIHALTANEAADVSEATGRIDISIIPNAVELPNTAPVERDAGLLYLGRIHSIKNLSGLIDGWALAREAHGFSGAKLTIAGWGEASEVAALEQKISLAGGNDIQFIGPAYGTDKANLLGTARYVALPSLSEGLPMAILEAWAAGTPTLMSHHCRLSEGFEQGAAFDCGTTPNEIAACLRRAFSVDDKSWQAMSESARHLVSTKFSPETISGRWREVYIKYLPLCEAL